VADHRAEQIVVAVLAKVTGLTTTGTRVFRGRVYPLQDTEEPALCVFMGADTPIAMLSQSLIDGELEVVITAVVKTSATQIDTLLNQIRKEVTIALQADYTQGLTFLHDSMEGEAARPELSGEADKPTASQQLNWKFHYRRSRTDPSL
jgi:hypothetical protein